MAVVDTEDTVYAGTPVSNDAGGGVGSDTLTAGIPCTRIVPPVKNCLSRLLMIDYEAQATAHYVTAMTPLGDVTPTITADVAVNGTVLSISAPVHDVSGAEPAAGDWIVVRDAARVLRRFQIASYAANAITILGTASYGDANGTGVPSVIPIGNKVWFFGSPTVDHPRRRFYFRASTARALNGVLCVTPKVYQPILVHSPNTTNEALAFQISYDNPLPTAA